MSDDRQRTHAPTAKRGKLTPRREKSDSGNIAQAMIYAAAPNLQPAQMSGSPAQQLQALQNMAVTPERIAALESTLLGLSERALQHVGHHLITSEPGTDIPKGLKEATTVAAIMIDKLLLLQQNRSNLEGRSGTATMSELTSKAESILAVVREVERRQSQTIDVTPRQNTGSATANS